MSAELSVPPSQRRFRFPEVAGIFIRPKQTFVRLFEDTNANWLTPMLIFTVASILLVLANGFLRQQAAAMGQITYPPDFQWYTPEQQAQYIQAAQATSSPVFIFAIPVMVSLVNVWGGWLLLAGIMHLVLTLLGGRGETTQSLNLLAWASLPLALRELIRAIATLVSQTALVNPGLSGFVSPGEDFLPQFLNQFLGQIDIYTIWYIVLIIIGAQIGMRISPAKAAGGVIVTMLIVYSLMSILGAVMMGLGELTLVRPFFF